MIRNKQSSPTAPNMRIRCYEFGLGGPETREVQSEFLLALSGFRILALTSTLCCGSHHFYMKSLSSTF